LQKEQSEWPVSREESMKKHDRAMEILDERVKDLVSGFGEYLRRQHAR
jgi:hypothetical protein